jgi:hypothetical protein
MSTSNKIAIHNVNYLPYGYGFKAWVGSYYQQILQALFPSPLIQIIGLFIMIPFLFILCLPLVLPGLAGISSLHQPNRARIFSAVMLPYWAAGFSLWVSELHRTDIMHLAIGSALLLIILLVTWSYCFNNKRVFQILGLGLIALNYDHNLSWNR